MTLLNKSHSKSIKRFGLFEKKFYQKEFKKKASKSDKYHINQLFILEKLDDQRKLKQFSFRLSYQFLSLGNILIAIKIEVIGLTLKILNIRLTLI